MLTSVQWGGVVVASLGVVGELYQKFGGKHDKKPEKATQ